MTTDHPTSTHSLHCCGLGTDGCDTCADRAVPVRVLRVDASSALVEDDYGHRAEISVALLPPTRPRDLLLVHAGVAIARVEET